jgi:hypothetical protein
MSRKEENTTYTILPFRELAATNRGETLHCCLVIIIPEKFHTTPIKRKVTKISEFAKISSLNCLTIPTPQNEPHGPRHSASLCLSEYGNQRTADPICMAADQQLLSTCQETREQSIGHNIPED